MRKYRSALVLLLLIAILSLMPGGNTFTHAQGSCEAVITALANAASSCKGIRDEVCYGHRYINADFKMKVTFSSPGHRADVADLKTLNTIPDEGVALMRVGDVTLVLYGSAGLATTPTQAFTLSMNEEPICEYTPSAMMLQTETGTTGYITVNGVEIKLGSTALITMESAKVTVAPYADRVVSFTPGSTASIKFGNPQTAIGPPDFNRTALTGFLTLGVGGSVTLEFVNNVAVDGPGPDIEIVGDPDNDEQWIAEASADGVSYKSFGKVREQAALDLATVGLASARFVRLTDDRDPSGGPSPGAELDAVEALNSAAPGVPPSPTAPAASPIESWMTVTNIEGYVEVRLMGGPWVTVEEGQQVQIQLSNQQPVCPVCFEGPTPAGPILKSPVVQRATRELRQVVTGAAGACTPNAAFVADVTIPDYTTIQPGERFDKIWRLRNTGTCPWGAGYRLAFVSGEQMGAPASQAVSSTPPGGTADISVPMYAPASPGTYEGRWRMVDPNNAPFGPTVTVIIQVPAPPTAPPTPTWTPTPTATTPPPPPPPSPEPVSINFRVDNDYISQGQCTTLHWDVENVREVYLDGAGVAGHESKQVCPSTTTTYTLHVVKPDGSSEDQRLTINVTPGPISINFRVDNNQIVAGQCTTLHWDVENVREVYLNDEGVVGHGSKQVCPNTTTTYTLHVVKRDGNSEDRALTITVEEVPVYINFWADNDYIRAGECTTLRWDVENVREVYLDGEEVVGHGSKQVCPPTTTTYTLHVVELDGSSEGRWLTITVEEVPIYIDFWADDYEIPGGRTTLHWETENVREVYLDGEVVAGDGWKEVWPPTTTTYTLHVVKLDGSSEYRSLTITVYTIE